MSLPGRDAEWLAEYLAKLRGEDPVDAGRVKEFGMPFSVPGPADDEAEAFLDLLATRAAELPTRARVIAQTHLFGKGTVAARARAVHKALDDQTDRGGSETALRNGRGAALRQLAHELAPSLRLASAVGPSKKSSAPAGTERAEWYEVTGIDWELQLDPADHRLQRWRVRETIRSLWPAQPIVFITLEWSGTRGRDRDAQESDPVVLSGPKRGRFKHEFLRRRPADVLPAGDETYIFDLGRRLHTDAVADIEFTMTLFDADDSFEPHLLWRTYRRPALEVLSARVEPGGRELTEVVARRERLENPGDPVFMPVGGELPVTRDPEGGYNVTFREFSAVKQEQCVLRWRDSY